MKRYALAIAVTLLAIGVDGTLSHDAMHESDRQMNSREVPSSETGCSLCAAHKADLELMRQANEERSLLGRLTETNSDLLTNH